MLQLTGIKKKYITGELVQQALKDVNLSFRNSEFVSILGPSGSGKSTLLNIIGGLDHYDEGDLVIDGVSTKKYRDHDWDSYRNHTIGFVFQSYNLIEHQTVMANVELALTISGISKEQRRQRALDVLNQVGLKEHAHKKPSQLSGGQMQRVAIARALINNPKILLADEPTGALDSATSVQVMELLKEVAKDRLVIMVTHNAELANKYSTRIVELRDGEIVSDSDSFKPEFSQPAINRNFGKASMSLLTSIGLSFNNLKTKLNRTLMIAFAGSIGIIGITLILAITNGVNRYINDTEEKTMLKYPIEIESSGFSIMRGFNKNEETSNDGDINEIEMLNNFLSLVNKNDLASLRDYFEKDKKIYDYTHAIEYSYDIEPYIYIEQNNNEYQVNPNESFSPLGVSSSSMIFANSRINSFYNLPSNEDLYKDKFDVKFGHWPENSNEAVVVTDSKGRLSDFTFYSLGLRDNEKLQDVLNKLAANDNVKMDEDDRIWKYEDVIGVTFKVLSPSQLYSYDKSNEIYIDRSNDSEYLKSVIDKEGMNLVVVGVVSPKDSDTSTLDMGIWYENSLIGDLREVAENSDVVKAQKKTPKINILTGKEFGEKADNKIDLSKLFSVDEERMASAFNFDLSKLDFSMSKFDILKFGNIDFSSLSPSIKDMSKNFSIDDLDIKIDYDKLQELVKNLASGYLDYAKNNPSTDYIKLPQAISEYLKSDESKNIISSEINNFISKNKDIISNDDINGIIISLISGYPDFAKENGYTDSNKIGEYLIEYLKSADVQELASKETENLIRKIKENIKLGDENISDIVNKLAESYTKYAETNNLPDLTLLQNSFKEYMDTDGAKKIFSDGLNSAVNVEEIKSQIEKNSPLTEENMSIFFSELMNGIGMQISGSMEEMLKGSAESLSDVFSVNTDELGKSIKMNFTDDEIKSLILSVSSTGKTSYSGNLSKFGYADDKNLSRISIYPKDFESKQKISDLISEYNKKVEDEGTPEKSIVYSDIIGILLSSVTQIINMISYILIAFVGISLIVSSIMIGVITYISVLERRKEIGILRAIGASKNNISQVFNAETGIIGLMAGLIGIIISLALTVPINLVLRNATGITELGVFLKPVQIISLIMLSVVLTLLGGLIPAKSAAKSDPVASLRND